MQIGLSGREMFSFNPDLATDKDMDEGDEAVISYVSSEDNDDIIQYKEIDFTQIGDEAQEVFFELDFSFFNKNNAHFTIIFRKIVCHFPQNIFELKIIIFAKLCIIFVVLLAT